MIEWFRLLWCRLRYPRNDVRHWGARCDGKHDDTEALRRAVNQRR